VFKILHCLDKQWPTGAITFVQELPEVSDTSKWNLTTTLTGVMATHPKVEPIVVPDGSTFIVNFDGQVFVAGRETT